MMGIPRGSAPSAWAPADRAVFLLQHMSSRRHKDRLAGKPPKPKYSPYNKLQKNAALAVSILKVPVSPHTTRPLCSPSTAPTSATPCSERHGVPTAPSELLPVGRAGCGGERSLESGWVGRKAQG